MQDHALLVKIANRLGLVADGSPEADRAIHDAFERTGTPPPYTRDIKAARTLLPPGFEVRPPISAGGRTYASIRRLGLSEGRPQPHVGQWGSTPALALSGAALRAHAAITRANRGDG
jgi:hypothetical protein